MEEFYRAIEERIRAAGYLGEVSGYDIYNDICDRMEDKESGEYLLMSRQSDEVWMEYRIQIHEEDFNLSSIDIHAGEQVYHVNFDD